MPQPDRNLPEHIESTVAAIADLHAEHDRKAGPVQRMVIVVTALLARPRTLTYLTVGIIGWFVANLALLAAGQATLDAPPFPYLADAASILALYLTTIILITQRHDDDLATRRDQLTLELAILSDQKASKIITLLEDLRRRDPDTDQSRDKHAEELSEVRQPQETLQALQAAHGALDRQEND